VPSWRFVECERVVVKVTEEAADSTIDVRAVVAVKFFLRICIRKGVTARKKGAESWLRELPQKVCEKDELISDQLEGAGPLFSGVALSLKESCFIPATVAASCVVIRSGTE